MKRTVQTLGLLLVAGLLSACHQNPLAAHSVKKTTRFLVMASQAASTQLQLGLWERPAQNLYLSCAEGSASTLTDNKGKLALIDCMDVYKAMIGFAQTYDVPGFKGLQVADLTDEKAITAFRDEYEERVAFGNLEH